MATIHVPTQRTSPDLEAAAAASVPANVEPGWGPLLRRTAARAGLAMVASLVLWSLLPALLGWAPRVILSGSMEPRIHSGDVIVTRDVQGATLSKGQVITVQDPDHPEKTRTHRFVRYDADGTIVTKGDANPEADSSHVGAADVLGLGVIRVPFVGRPAYWMAQHNYGALGVTFLLLGIGVISAFPGRPRSQDENDSPGSGPTPRTRRTRPVRSARTSRRRRVAAAVTVSVIAVGAVGGPADAAFKRLAQNTTSTLSAASTFYSYKSEVRGDSPYLYWKLDETGGTAIADSSAGTSRPGTLLAQTYSLGQAGALAETPNRAIDFTVASITSNASYSGLASFSVEAWVKTTSTSGGRILGFGNGSGQSASSTVDRQLYLGSGGKVFFGIGSAKTTVASTRAVNDNAWHHVVGTFTTGSNGMKLYVDGVLQGQARATTVLTSGFWRAGAEGMSGWSSNPGQYFDGTMDELAVYSDVLTPTEVQAHYAAAS